MTAADPLGMIGQVLHGQFRVDDLVEDGKRSLLYRGAHLMLEVPIAIKCMKAPPGGSHEQFIRRFRHESRLHYKLSQASPHVVRVLASGTAVAPTGSQLTPFMVLEWLEGETLAADIASRRAQGFQGRTLAEAIRLLDPPVEALAFAHTQGIVHREVTPETLFVARMGDGSRAIKVLDFGVAKILSERALDLAPASQSMGLVPIGSPAYAAPEQYSSSIGVVGPWTDVYAIAMVLLEMLMDRPVMEDGAVPMGVRVLDMKQRPTPRALGLEVSDRVEEVLAQAVAARPEDRQREAGEFWGMLKNALMRDQDSLLRVSKLPVTEIPFHAQGQGSDSRTAALNLVYQRSTVPEEMRQTVTPQGDSGQGPALGVTMADELPPSSREPPTMVVREEELSYEDIPVGDLGAKTIERHVPRSTLEALARGGPLSPASPPESSDERTVVMQLDDLRNMTQGMDPAPLSSGGELFLNAGPARPSSEMNRDFVVAKDADVTQSHPDTTTRAPLQAPVPKAPVVPGPQWPFQQGQIQQGQGAPFPGQAGGYAQNPPVGHGPFASGQMSAAFPPSGQAPSAFPQVPFAGQPGQGGFPQGQMPGQPPGAFPFQQAQLPGQNGPLQGGPPPGMFPQGAVPAQPKKAAASSVILTVIIILVLFLLVGAAMFMAKRLGWI